jgi:hypothetical protein
MAGAKNQSTTTAGSRIVLVGLSVSLSVFVFFLFLCIYLHVRIAREQKASGHSEKWKNIFWVLYFDMTLLTIRSIYRVYEYVKAMDGVTLSESYFYGLDLALMVLLLLAWIPFHPGLQDMSKSDEEEEAARV